MAHYEATAVGGYYPLPPAIVPHLARLINTLPAQQHKQQWGKRTTYGAYNLFDPCAGTGAALAQIAKALFPCLEKEEMLDGCPTVRLYGAELEQCRAATLQTTLKSCTANAYAYHADAFTLDWKANWSTSPRMQFALLNPPYDVDKVYGRLEHRFLERMTHSLEPGTGILLYVVPHYTLGVSAKLLASHYTNISCFRFPEELFPIYKQVVLIAQRRKMDVTYSDPECVSMIERWSAAAHTIPRIDQQTNPCIVLPPNDARAVELCVKEADEAHLQKVYLPFHQGAIGKQKPIPGMGIKPLNEILGAVYPVVLPPKPAHIALALASGLFNGFEVYPDDEASFFPPLVVKGIYTKVAKKTEEKRDKDGQVTKKIYVEQPSLEVVVLNLRTHAYFNLNAGTTPSGASLLSDFNIADLLAHYGKNLTVMMQEKCPPLHDPTDPDKQLVLPRYGFTPYPAQSQVIQANLKMLFTDKAPFTDNPFVLGEVGTGKTFMAEAILAALSKENFPKTQKQLQEMGIQGGRISTIRNCLVVCPPHLVQGWKEQTEQILPSARIRILKRVSDVVAAVNMIAQTPPHPTFLPGDGLNIFIMSREMGKLGHAWIGVKDKNGCCPQCGRPVMTSRAKLLKERQSCTATSFTPANETAVFVQRLAQSLSPALPQNPLLRELVNGRIFHSYLDTLSQRFNALHVQSNQQTETLRRKASVLLWQKKGADLSKPLAKTAVGQIGIWLRKQLIKLCMDKRRAAELFVDDVLLPYLMIFTHPERDRFIVQLLQDIFSLPEIEADQEEYGRAESIRTGLATAVFLIQDQEVRQSLFEWVKARLVSTAADRMNATREKLNVLRAGQEWNPPSYRDTYNVEVKQGQLTYRAGWGEPEYVQGTPQAALQLLKRLLEDTDYQESTVCGSPLYTAVPQPRRFPLATLIAKRYPQLVDFLIVDEAHENANGDSAQAQAAHRLEQLGVPTLHLTGTNSNGYASSMFANMWVASENFRQAFGRDDLPHFVDTFGYRKLAEDVEHDETTVKIGVQSDRQASGKDLYLRKIGQAPGILPMFIFKYLLQVATAIQKEDLNANLPPLEEIGVPIALDGSHPAEMNRQLVDMQRQLTETILSLRGSPLAGKLWGAYAQLPSYLDRAHADTGNESLEDGTRRFAIRYPESEGGHLIKAATPYPTEILMPKETWLIDKVRAELMMNNFCLVFVWNTGSGLANRVYHFLSQAIGSDVALLNPKVKAVNRQAWIQKHVIDKRKKVLICNPKAVETGLNNLTWFNRAIWFQNPNANAILFRQANGRIHRIGQKADTVKVYVPYYDGTTQATLFQLLALKIQAAVQIDGVDIESALVTAGASLEGAPGLDGLSIGKALYEMMQNGQKQEAVHFQQEVIDTLFQVKASKIVEPVFAF